MATTQTQLNENFYYYNSLLPEADVDTYPMDKYLAVIELVANLGFQVLVAKLLMLPLD